MRSFVLLIISSLLFLNPLYSREGRNLLLDKSLVSETDMQFKYHFPEYYALNPVLKADKTWEFNKNGDPYAAPFSGGVWYDELSGSLIKTEILMQLLLVVGYGTMNYPENLKCGILPVGVRQMGL